MWARRYEKGDYLLVTGLGWVEFDGTSNHDIANHCWRGKGLLRTDPLPPGRETNDLVTFDLSSVEAVTPAAEVNNRILHDFFRISHPKDADGFAEAWDEDDRSVGMIDGARLLRYAAACFAAAVLAFIAFLLIAP